MYIGKFHSSARGYLRELDPEARMLLAKISSEIITLLDAPADDADLLHALALDERREPPEDPALLALLPYMSEDQQEATALRTLTEDTLRMTKSERLVRIVETMEELAASGEDALEVGADEAWEWLCALNDMRLVLAQRLDVNSPQDVERVTRRAEIFFSPQPDFNEDDLDFGPNRMEDVIAALYVVVTWWQDSLLQAVRFNEASQ